MFENKKKIKELEERNLFLTCDNLKMRLDIDVLLDTPDSKAAKIILDRYRQKRAQRDNALLEIQN